MALSGSFDTSGYEGRKWRFSWTATQNVADNTSTISWSVSAVGGSAGWYMCGPFTIDVAGSKWSKTGRWKQYKGTLTSGTKTISHSATGTASFTVSIDSAIYYYATGTGNGSKTFTLNTIPRASSISCGTLTMGSSGTISVSRASTSFTHTIKYTFGTKSGTICNKSSATSVSWKPPLDLAHMIPNSTSGTGTLTCETYSGNTKIGSKSISFTCNVPSSVVPSCSATVTNTNNTFGCYAQILSGVKVKPSASGSYSSTIKSIKISVTDMSDKSASNGVEYTFDAFTKTGTKTIKVTATDSRGRTKSWSTTVSVVAYSLPTAKVSASRGNGSTTGSFVASDTGDHAKITAIGSVSNISGNYLTPTLQYRIAGSSAWTNLSVSASGLSLNSVLVIAASDVNAYDIRLVVKDKSGRSATATMTLSNGFATMDYKAGGDGVAFGMTATRAGLDCAMLMRILNSTYLMSDSSGGYGQAYWLYNDSGTQKQVARLYAASDGFHMNVPTGKGFLQGTWSGTLSDMRMKRDIEPIAQDIIKAVGEVPFVQFRMSADGYDHDELCVGILAQDLKDAFTRHNVEDKLLMLDTVKLNPDGDDEYYCIEYTHFLIVRLLYDELKIYDFENRLNKIEKVLNV